MRRNRGFNLLWFGEGVSVLGNSMTTILLPLLAVTTFHAGAAWMGVLTAAAWLPWLVVGLPAGAWVDRMAPRTVMIASDLAAAVALVSVPVAWALGVLTLGHLVVAALAGGVCTVFLRTAYTKLVPAVVPEGQLLAANARLIGTESAMQIAGPGLGGLIAQAVSVVGGLLVDVASFLVSAWSLWRIRLAPAAAPAEQTASLGTRIREGLRFVAGDRILRYFTVLGGLSNFGLTGYTALLVLLLVREGELSPGAVGMVMALGSVGGLIGATIATRVSRALGSARAIIWLQLLAGPPALLVATIRPGLGVAPVVLGILLVGTGVVAGNVIRGAWRQQYVPAGLMGRVLTAVQVVNFGTMPLAGVAAGVLGTALGVRGAVALMAGVHAVACLLIFWSPVRHLRDLPARPAPARALQDA
ncbi:MAG: MFS transporter [Micromonosporaceae bacterium]